MTTRPDPSRRTHPSFARPGRSDPGCLAGLAARSASQIFAMEGCPRNWAGKALARAGFHRVPRGWLNDPGAHKDQSLRTPVRVRRVAEEAGERLKESNA